MAELGTPTQGLALSIYAHAMRREDGENERLKALVEGVELRGLGTSAHSENGGKLAAGTGSETLPAPPAGSS